MRRVEMMKFRVLIRSRLVGLMMVRVVVVSGGVVILIMLLID